MSDKSEARQLLWALRSRVKLGRFILQKQFGPTVTSRLWKAEQELKQAERYLETEGPRRSS